jgi:hypothetical protein
MQFRLMSEFIPDARRNLIVAQFLLEAYEAETQGSVLDIPRIWIGTRSSGIPGR